MKKRSEDRGVYWYTRERREWGGAVLSSSTCDLELPLSRSSFILKTDIVLKYLTKFNLE